MDLDALVQCPDLKDQGKPWTPMTRIGRLDFGAIVGFFAFALDSVRFQGFNVESYVDGNGDLLKTMKE